MMEISVNRPRKKRWRLLVIFAALLVISSFLTNRLINQQYLALDPNDKKPVDIVIPAESNARQIAAILKESDLIRSDNAFLAYCRKEKLDTQLKPGHYTFTRSQSVAQIAGIIAKGQVVKIKVTVPEGYTVKEIGAMLEEKGICTEASWQEAINADYSYDFLNDVSEDSKYRLEGFLFPDTYYIEENTSSREIVDIMLKNFADIWDKEFASQAQAMHMSTYDVVTLASLIEEEAMHDDERKTISGVIHNRLRDGMLLQLCPTVLYCFDQKKTKLNDADLEVDSPYNTYRHPGLPPGPIANPGKASIAAALDPEQHPYYYYVSKGDGSHYFSRTYQEHLQAMSRYIQ